MLRLAEHRFDVSVTMDRRLPFQQDLHGLDLCTILLIARSNDISENGVLSAKSGSHQPDGQAGAGEPVQSGSCLTTACSGRCCAPLLLGVRLFPRSLELQPISRNQIRSSRCTVGLSLRLRQALAAFLSTSPWVG